MAIILFFFSSAELARYCISNVWVYFLQVKVPEHFTIKMAPQHHAAHPFHSHGHKK